MEKQDLIKAKESFLELVSNCKEILMKGPNYYKDKDPAKYKKMLNKLAKERKTKGHKERATQQVLQAKRREKGGPGTTAGQNGKSGHSSGHMKASTGSAAKRFASSEKKSNEKLSIDRKDNNKGYESGNTRNVPQRLNRGSHKVDPKKLKNWKKKLKKSEDVEMLKSILIKNHGSDNAETIMSELADFLD